MHGRCPFGNQVYRFLISTVFFFQRSGEWDVLIKPLLRGTDLRVLKAFSNCNK